MTRVGALMSPELVAEMSQALASLPIEVVDLGWSVSSIRPGSLGDLASVVVELSESVLDDDLGVLWSGPCAGIPVTSGSEGLATAHGITTVLHGPDDLEAFVTEGFEGSDELPHEPAHPPAPGMIIAVWGPAGAPGRTTVAIAIAAGLARRSGRVVLADSDTYAPALAPLLAITSVQPGVVQASRSARLDSCEPESLIAATTPFSDNGVFFPVMTGLRNATQFADCSQTSWSRVLSTLKDAGHMVVVDLAPPLEQFSHEVVGGPLRNALAIATLEAADAVATVARATPLSILRLSRAWPRLRELAPGADIHSVLNATSQHDDGSVEEARHALWQFTGQDEVTRIGLERSHGPLTASGLDSVTASGLHGLLAKSITPVVEALAPAPPGVGSTATPPTPRAQRLPRLERWFPRLGKRLL